MKSIKIAGTELIGPDDPSTGIGVNLFIRKNKPGPTVNVGYTVEVFENGIKAEEISAKDKKYVKEIIDKYKDMYNTGRAFQNENHLHITYKSKEERGEDVFDTGPNKATEEKEDKPKAKGEPFEEVSEVETSKELGSKEKPPELTKRKETAMSDLDKVLTKKANTIRNILHRLTSPTLPVIKKAEEAALPQNAPLDSIPQTDAPGLAEPAAPENDVAKEVAIQLVKYVQEDYQQPADELYNGIKHWFSEVKKQLKNYERMMSSEQGQGAGLDRSSVAQKIKEVVTSGDPARIKEFTGIEISPEVAKVLQEVSLMEIGTPQEGKISDEGFVEKSTIVEDLGKAASSMEEKANKLVGQIKTIPLEHAVLTAEQNVGEEFGDNVDIIQELVQFLPETASGEAIIRAIESISEEYEKDEEKSDGSAPLTIIDLRSKEFWAYAARIKKAISLEDAFSSWILENEMNNINKTAPVWTRVAQDVMDAFCKKKEINKKAQFEDWGLGRITITSYDAEEGGKTIAHQGYFEYSKHSLRLSYGETTENTPSSYGDLSRLINAFMNNERMMDISIDDAAETVRITMEMLKSDVSVFDAYLKDAYGQDITGSVRVDVELKNHPGGVVVATDAYALSREEGEEQFKVS